MKFILIILTITMKVIAFEQIYAVNSGGEAHTDSDGIIYQTQTENKNRENYNVNLYSFDIGSVPASDKPIYFTTERSEFSLTYDLPLVSDGLYVLIAKIMSRRGQGSAFISAKLNDIQLISNADPFVLCGGEGYICDKYFYICVADKKIYYENQSSLVEDYQIRVEFSANEDWVRVAGLVMLKGTVGEHQKLIGSATKETMHFNSSNTNLVCLVKEEIINLQKNMKSISNQSLKNISHMNAEIVSSIENVLNVSEKAQATLLSEIQSIQTEQCNGSNIKILFNLLESKIVEILQAENRKVQTEVKQMTLEGHRNVETRIEEFTLKVQAEQAALKHAMEAISKKLDLLLNLQTSTDSPEIRNSD
jgi:Malectin domain